MPVSLQTRTYYTDFLPPKSRAFRFGCFLVCECCGVYRRQLTAGTSTRAAWEKDTPLAEGHTRTQVYSDSNGDAAINVCCLWFGYPPLLPVCASHHAKNGCLQILPNLTFTRKRRYLKKEGQICILRLLMMSRQKTVDNLWITPRMGGDYAGITLEKWKDAVFPCDNIMQSCGGML